MVDDGIGGKRPAPGLSERRMRYFYAVVLSGSIRGAADLLNAEPSVISRQVQLLEQELDVTLFERRGRGVVPTEFAQLVVDHCRTCMSSLETLMAQLAELQGMQKGRIRIVAGEGFARELIDIAVNSFCREFPMVSVSLELTSLVQVLNAVADDEAQIGVAFGASDDPRLKVVAEKRHAVSAVFRPDHPLASAHAPVGLPTIAQHPVAIMPPEFGLGQLVRLAEFSEDARLAPSLVTNSISALKHYAYSGLGVTFLPMLDVAEDVRAGRLMSVRTASPVLEQAKARLLLRDGRVQLPAVNALIGRLSTMSSLSLH
jgi:DNA-binding transcriptional LysR family regulator